MKPIEQLNQLTTSESLYGHLTDQYMPSRGQGENKAQQLVTATNKILYKWYNDGDTIDCNGNYLTSYANWIETNFKDTKSIFDAAVGIGYNDDAYITDVLIPLTKFTFNESLLSELEKQSSVGSIYNYDGRFVY